MKAYTLLTCLILATLKISRVELVRATNHILSKRLIWKKVATICMRRDVRITYKVRYNADRGCCPKLLLYTDQQYQRLIFMKGLEIMREEEEDKKMGWSVRQRTIPNNPNRKKRNPSMYQVPSRLDSFTDDGVWSSLHQSTELEEMMEKMFRLKRSLVNSDSEITYAKVIDRLYYSSTTFFSDAESRLKAIYSCSKANKTMKQVLDSTQVVKLCPSSGISIDSKGRSFKACRGTIKPLEQVSLPNLTSVQSWFGSEETAGGNSEQSYWTPNTWHIILYNCPGSPSMNISYVIDFDKFSNIDKTQNDPDYGSPKLQKTCPETVLPAYTAADGIPEGSSAFCRSDSRLHLSLAVIVMLAFLSL